MWSASNGGHTSFVAELPRRGEVRSEDQIGWRSPGPNADTQQLLRSIVERLRVQVFEVKAPSLHEDLRDNGWTKLCAKFLRSRSASSSRSGQTRTFILMILMLPVMIRSDHIFAERLNALAGTRPGHEIVVTDLSDKLRARSRTFVRAGTNSSHPDSKIFCRELPAGE